MYFRQRTLGRMAAPVQPAAQTVTIPASVGGINALDPLIALPPEDCYYTYNLMPSEFGLRVRKGYREYVTGIGSTSTLVRAILPFEGSNSANDKLFATTPDGIYDVSTDGDTTPTLVQAFTTTTPTSGAGFCNWTEFTTDAGETYLFVADQANGIFQYRESTGVWSVPTLTGVTAANVRFVSLHKQRLYVIEKDSTDAFYGPVASISGTFTPFTFGSKFRYGGTLLGVYNWTLDGGNGVDDYMIAISQGGDVLAYRGSDPSATDWEIVGSFFVGEMPNSRTCVHTYAGELFILSTFGVVSLRDLVSGVDASDTFRSPSAKINRILRDQVQANKDQQGWFMQTYPGDGFMQIIQPYSQSPAAIQYNQNLQTKAWGYWKNVPIICADTWQGNYYMGGEDGQVWKYDGVLDNTLIDGTLGAAIEFSILTSFQAAGDHSLYKRIGMIRVVSIAGGDTAYNVKAVYDYNIQAEAVSPSSGTIPESSLWDVATWNTAVWDGVLTGQSQIEGGAGIGRTIAVAMKGETASRLTVIGWDISLTGGGFL